METTPAHDHEHQVVEDLTLYLDRTVPLITLETAPWNVFASAAFLYRCNRLLMGINDAVERGLGDTTGSNVRALYETWVYGHLLLLGDKEENHAMIASARGRAEKVDRAIQALGIEHEPVPYDDIVPNAICDISIRQRAETLGKKLQTADPAHAELPVDCYESIFRYESHLSTHANFGLLSTYVSQVDGHNATIGVAAGNQGHADNRRLAAYITTYFASQVLLEVGIDIR